MSFHTRAEVNGAILTWTQEPSAIARARSILLRAATRDRREVLRCVAGNGQHYEAQERPPDAGAFAHLLDAAGKDSVQQVQAAR